MLLKQCRIPYDIPARHQKLALMNLATYIVPLKLAMPEPTPHLTDPGSLLNARPMDDQVIEVVQRNVSPRRRDLMTPNPPSPINSYDSFLRELKDRIRTAQVRAGLAVNRELVLLYWGIGRDILERQEREGWGTKVIDRLARDLSRAFPEVTGFSARNPKYMRSFAEA